MIRLITIAPQPTSTPLMPHLLVLSLAKARMPAALLLCGFADRPCGAKPAHMSTRRAYLGLVCPDTKFRGNASRRGARHGKYPFGLLSEPRVPHSGSHPLFVIVAAQSEGRSHRLSPGRRTLSRLGYRRQARVGTSFRPLPTTRSDVLPTSSSQTGGRGSLNAAPMSLPDGASRSECCRYALLPYYWPSPPPPPLSPYG